MKKWLLLLLIPLAITGAAVAHDNHESSGMTAEKAWARKTSRTVSAAVYLTLHNNGHHMDMLTGAASPAAQNVEVHRSYEQDSIMRMEHVEELPIAPGEAFAFKPGGYHIMLTGLATPLEEGSRFPVTLYFRKSGPLEINVTVTGMAGLKP